MNHPGEVYLGDGLYARNDGWMIWLRAPRMDGDHEVAIEPDVFAGLLKFAAKSWNTDALIEIIKEQAKLNGGGGES